VSKFRPVTKESKANDEFLNQFNTRHEFALLAPEGSIGAELGVDAGQLSERFLNLNHFSSFHCVDKWDSENDEWDKYDLHGRHQYLSVAMRLMGYPTARVWRMTAQEWAERIPDESLGFVYIDCYAHTGQDDGEILKLLWPKMAPGGVFAGDDYDSKKWRPTYDAVNKFAEELGVEVCINDSFCHPQTATRTWQDASPTWYWIK
jgi:hypothetical protein